MTFIFFRCVSNLEGKTHVHAQRNIRRKDTAIAVDLSCTLERIHIPSGKTEKKYIATSNEKGCVFITSRGYTKAIPEQW